MSINIKKVGTGFLFFHTILRAWSLHVLLVIAGFFPDSLACPYIPNTCVRMSRLLEIARRCKCECEFSIWPQILLTGVEVQSLRGARPRDLLCSSLLSHFGSRSLANTSDVQEKG